MLICMLSESSATVCVKGDAREGSRDSSESSATVCEGGRKRRLKGLLGTQHAVERMFRAVEACA
eukprot:355607-Chlamydomonas_euryale.AAC.8